MIRRLLLALAILAGGFGSPSPARAAETQTVRLTHYWWTGSVMYDGEYPFAGAAACSWNFPLGTTVTFADGYSVTCLDRGMLGSTGWVDVYGWNAEAAYGRYPEVEIELPDAQR